MPAFVDTEEGRVPVPGAFVAAIKSKFSGGDCKLVIGCHAGVRSKAAAQWLCDEGFSQVPKSGQTIFPKILMHLPALLLRSSLCEVLKTCCGNACCFQLFLCLQAVGASL